MMIDRIGSIDPIQPGKKTNRSGQVNPGSQADSIALSREAKEKAEIYQTLELVSAAPATRADRIAELKEKINDPDYLNDVVIKATADKIMDAFGL
ncbi:MAG: flagellar biosynthesis anti-sigma factor FlgM [Spirochaetaceae bacterium]|jgi:negative regulator of flagellin synthesis FlgM|nr:flagellar biosynthesis anti-sigma factor FlgM [Spirochaetaceae bacterium]